MRLILTKYKDANKIKTYKKENILYTLKRIRYLIKKIRFPINKCCTISKFAEK